MGVTSTQGKGSEFWFTVRLLRDSRSASAQTQSQTLAALKGVRVLIVDDNPTNREILTTLTASWGMRPSEAEGGIWALQAMYQSLEVNDPYQIAVIDMLMPGMDGEALGCAILADTRFSATKLVMLTSLGAQRGQGRCKQIGLASWATKPIRSKDLLAHLSKALSAANVPDSPPAVTAERDALESVTRPVPPIVRSKARILIAEDNCTNQEVAVGILKMLGLGADTVSDGAEAIQSLETIPYDLVLMDVRMPLMDGIEATRRIRDSQSCVLDHSVPIIAMTANVLQDDRDECIEAGMNGFVPKPISPQSLREALERWLPHHENEQDSSGEDDAPIESEPKEAPQPVPSQAASVFDADSLLARVMGDRELAISVVEGFVEEFAPRLQDLHAQMSVANLPGVRSHAHAIKGSAATVSADCLSATALKIERAAGAGEAENMEGFFATMVDDFEQFKQALTDSGWL